MWLVKQQVAFIVFRGLKILKSDVISLAVLINFANFVFDMAKNIAYPMNLTNQTTNRIITINTKSAYRNTATPQ